MKTIKIVCELLVNDDVDYETAKKALEDYVANVDYSNTLDCMGDHPLQITLDDDEDITPFESCGWYVEESAA